MSEKEFELYLSLLSRFLRLKPGQHGEIAEELRDHLEARLEELSRAGLARDEAIRSALEEFGDAAELASHFTQITQRRKRRFLMRCTFGSIVALAAAILIATAFWPPNQGAQIPARALAQEAEDTNEAAVPTDDPALVKPANDARYASVEKKLKQPLDLSVDETALSEALEFIADRIEVDILINEMSLLEAGINTDEPITFHLGYTQPSAATCLNLILEKLDLTYRIRDGLIVVETIESAHTVMEVHVYNCRDLLWGVLKETSVSQTGAAGFGGGRGGGDRSVVRITPAEALIKVLIGATGGPWEANGSQGGSITEFNGLLVVRNNQQAQRNVKNVLEMLRAADKEIPFEAIAPPKAKPPTQEKPADPKR